MKVVVIGTRGIPNILGGVETHCEELFPRLVELGVDITICCRSCYVSENHPDVHRGVHLKTMYAPKKKAIEAITHSLLGVIYAKRVNADILHIHAIGPSLVAPIAKLLGLKVVMTHHGADYERQKWGIIAKKILRLGEKWGVRFSDSIIVISTIIQKSIAEKYGRKDCELIYNGVPVPHKSKDTNFINTWRLTPKKYILMMGRFVEEKGFHDGITAFLSSNLAQAGYQLVLAGDADHETSYSKQLKEKCKRENVILTGFIKGEQLNQLLTNAVLFLMPSYHEGLPIALLEAMSYDLDLLVSDISPNKAINLAPEDYFPTGNTKELSNALIQKLKAPQSNHKYDLSLYEWDSIAKQTFNFYQKTLGLVSSMG